MVSTIVAVIVSFISTNIDDIFVLMLFFSQINSNIKRYHIVIGQYLGIGVLTTISIIGDLGVSLISHEYIGILGFFPIYLGIKTFLDYKKENNRNINTSQKVFRNYHNNLNENMPQGQVSNIATFFKNLTNTNVMKVFIITLANGGDNIGIYIPIFSNMGLDDIVITIIIFILLVGFWCFIALKLAEHPFVKSKLEKYEHIFVPIVFIGLGIFIIIKSGIMYLLY